MGVRWEKEAGVGIVVLDRPPVNSHDAPFLREFGSVIDDLRFDEGIRAVVVTSASGKFFSAGADIKEFEAGSARRRAMMSLLGHEVFRKMEQTPLVFLACITGHCLGGGLELALACDLRFASAGGYRIGLPEVKLGLLPGAGGTQRLPRLVGLSRAIDLILTGAVLSPQEALDQGLVDRVFPDAEACFTACMDYARSLAKGPTEAVGHAKLAITAGYGAPLDLGLAVEREAIARVFDTQDASEGLRAFREKRAALFKGQ